MPCYLVVTIELRDRVTAEKALKELGLVEGRDYTWNGARVVLRNPAIEGRIKQRYGVIQAEATARRKGYRVQRKQREDGKIEVVLTR
ncbi:MAG: hypothetical protein Q8R28_15115 [Dehalococcoidia bacterium]|nr:hypothetical protein [Dehalococcoidia bacterium]